MTGVHKRIHVNQQRIRARQADALSVKTYDGNTIGSRVEILDQGGNVLAAVVVDLDHPLSCGARAWVETRAEVRVTAS